VLGVQVALCTSSNKGKEGYSKTMTKIMTRAYQENLPEVVIEGRKKLEHSTKKSRDVFILAHFNPLDYEEVTDVLMSS
jgi:hypothetical protein